jgi:hypothetical protein
VVGFSIGFAVEARNGVVGVAVPDPFWLVTRMSLVGHRNSILQRKGHRLCWPVPAVCVLGLVAEILICLFGCCEKLIWVGVGYFWWEIIIKK